MRDKIDSKLELAANNSGNLKFEYNYDYLVCFDYNTKATLHGRLFGHVFLYRNITATCSVKINPTISGIMMIPYTSRIQTFANSLIEDYNCYVYRVTHQEFMKPQAILGVGTCVSIVKNFLGVRAWWIITPKQLEKYLKKKGERW